MGKINELLTFTGFPLGTTVLGSIGRLITWRRRGRIQEKRYWLTTANPRRPRQQVGRFRFKWTVRLLKMRFKGTTELQARTDPLSGACPWFVSGMAWLMSADIQWFIHSPFVYLGYWLDYDPMDYIEIDLSEHLPPTAIAVLLHVRYWANDSSTNPSACWISTADKTWYHTVKPYPVNNVPQDALMMIPIDETRKVFLSTNAGAGVYQLVALYLEGYVYPKP